ncbi:hypothetical protein [Phyllobacterium chamaecytisi]|uniref:hypothetical protein n=1 Tax=Phyllobacterium chamaecytisi TaxID=2876082 RepID=UPI001CCE0276|nr:hypothetical protein [Phyllobacterium sp. KW56]MBZ9603988.1 hypothetical protein [Phyllobacterium sp. KW56]
MSIKTMFVLAVMAFSSSMLAGCLDSTGAAQWQSYHPDWTGSNGVSSGHSKH